MQQKAKKEGKEILLGSILLRMKLIDQKQLDFLLSMQMMMQQRKLDRQFGELAVKKGFLTEEDVQDALQEQEKIYKESQTVQLIGEILVEWGKLEPRRRDAILETQQRLSVFKQPPKGAETDKTPEEGREASGSGGAANDSPDSLFFMSIAPDAMSASITPNRPIPDSVTVSALKEFLNENNVVHGILDDGSLEEFLREKARSGHSFQIAAGTPPQPGQNAYIHYHFNTDPLRVGTIKEGGNIDFRDKGEIPQVKAGTLLAERIPPKEGSPGTNVSGKPVPPPKPQNAKLRKGKGVQISSDGMQLVAEVGGRPELSADGKVYVFSEHKINGDVDLKTGHVDFEGGILVNGSITKGFRVRGGSLSANEIIGAEIDIRGDVAITGGIIDATIRLGGNLRARYIHKTKIETYGDVVVDKEVIDADIESSGAFIVKNGPVLSSKIIAKKGIEVLQVGSKTSNPCELTIGTDDRVNNEVLKIHEKIDNNQSKLQEIFEIIEKYDNEKQNMALELGEEAQLQDKATVKKREIEEKISSFKENDEKHQKALDILAQLEKEITTREALLESFFEKEDKIDAEIDNYKNQIVKMEAITADLKSKVDELKEWAEGEECIPVLRVYGKLFPFANVKGPHTFMTVPKMYERVQIKEIKKEAEEKDKEYALKLSPLK